MAPLRIIGLEAKCTDKVDDTVIAALTVDQPKGCRVKVLRTVNEIRVIEYVDERGLQLELNSLADRPTLG